MLWTKNLSLRIGEKQILKGIDFEAHPGEIAAIVGPNGSGKSTLISALTGDRAYDGDAGLGGLDPATAQAWELAARRGVLAQHTSVAFPFTVAEVVRLGRVAGASGVGPDPVNQALARVGLHGYGARAYHTLSGGEQQRTQLARVLVQIGAPLDGDEARWLFLDEPVASLDIAHQLEVMEIARSFAAGGGGVVAVMHDLNLTAMYADRVALMAEGRIVSQGPVSEVLRNETLSQAYGCPIRVSCAPTDATFVLPHAAISP